VENHAKETFMRIIGLQRRVSPFLIAAVLVLQLSPALAAGQPEAQQAIIQGSRPVEVTFTKWVTTGTFLAGIAGGDIDGTFVGEVLEGQTSVNPEINPNPEGVPGPIVNGVRRLEALYQVNAENEEASFTALIRGGQNQVTGVAQFTGFVAAGWRTGAQVRVVFQRYFAGDPHCLAAGAPVTGGCFQGVIRVGRPPKE
jgi:hypothetical protein